MHHDCQAPEQLRVGCLADHAPARRQVLGTQSGSTTPNLDNRVVNQQKRIDQGVASGQLTAKETNRLDKREAKLAADVTAAKADGKVTRAERRRLQREANRDSKKIYRLKHNRRTVAPATAK